MITHIRDNSRQKSLGDKISHLQVVVVVVVVVLCVHHSK